MTERYRTERYELILPEGWDYEPSSASVAFFRLEHGQGAVNISSLQAPSLDSDPAGLFRELCKSTLPPKTLRSNQQEDVDVLAGEEAGGDRFWRYWVFWRAPVAVTVSYNCRLGREGNEREEVDQIVGSLRLL